MFCENCKIEIPPSFVKVIASNVCPGCEQPIMGEKTKELMVELTAAIAKMEHDPEGLASWIISNYNLNKTGSAQPTEFYRGKRAESSSDVGQRPPHSETYMQALARTDHGKTLQNRIPKQVQPTDYKAIVNQFNEEDSTMYGGVDDVVTSETGNPPEEMTPQQAREVMAMSSAPGGNISPAEAAALMGAMQGYSFGSEIGEHGGISADDNSILAQERKARLLKQQRVIQTGTGKSFRRG